LVLPAIPSEIYEGYQAGFAKIFSFAPGWMIHRFLKNRFRVDDFGKQLKNKEGGVNWMC
jgi:hypothetical protein